MNKSAESSIPLSRCVLVLAPFTQTLGNQLLDGSINLLPLSPSTTNDLPVTVATSLHQSLPDFVPFSGMVHHLPVVQTQTHTDTDRQAGRQIHTYKKKKLVTLGDGPGPASTEVEAPIPHCGATRATAEPGQPRPFSSWCMTCLVPFDLLSSHGSGSNLSVTASEINSRNSGICFCSGIFSKPRNLGLPTEHPLHLSWTRHSTRADSGTSADLY